MKFKILKLNVQLLPYTCVESLKLQLTEIHLVQMLIFCLFLRARFLCWNLPGVKLKPASLCSYDCNMSLLLYAQLPLVPHTASSPYPSSPPWLPLIFPNQYPELFLGSYLCEVYLVCQSMIGINVHFYINAVLLE